ncbi:hypothetical protein C5167_017923 [Papaver somniferum]|uniref:tRNA-splicing endonuclease subunit Sen54 N-terminal domain-containing protein n=1 Tax=Papaver somniferum TaxID=3469 RepID=A0A4Y7IPV9_PAPSO|nr:uncharacterized protein LOC113353289 [Papaver somniferum]XP_026452721.1 uncharacterized protein LOC113353289 [Papaver somniferum]RZC49505.1 hypothetical protein C5167_017923 [Papaver somniferum]
MEVKDWEVSSDGTQDSEVNLQDSDEDEHLFMFDCIPKLQQRKAKSKVCWDSEMRMAKVIEMKGRCWGTTGIVRNSETYLSIEETLFMAERGALLLVNSDDMVLSLRDMYGMLREWKNGCSWDSFQPYKHLKSLAYIVSRHGVPWTMKNHKHCTSPTCVRDSNNGSALSGTELEEGISITDGLGNMHINYEAKPTFDVFSPNRKFRKCAPGEPNFVVYLTREDNLPSKEEIEDLVARCKGVGLMVCHIQHGRVSLFSHKETELPLLP